MAILLISTLNAGAQMAMPDNVCIGATKHYNVDPNPIPGSTYTWKINGIIQSSTINAIDITWNTAGTFTLTVQETSTDGCQGPVQSGQVFVTALPAAPTATLTQPTCALSTGTITVTAPAPGAGMTYSIDGSAYTNTTGIFALLTANTYSVTAKNAAGCISAATTETINAQPATPAAPTATVTAQPTCTVSAGTITVTAPAPGAGISYTVTGTNPVVASVSNATGLFTALAPGVYDVTTSNAACVSLPTPLTVNPVPGTPAAPTVTLTQPTCALAKGTIVVTVQIAGETYSFDNGTTFQSGNSLSGLAAGTYNVIIKSTAGCNSNPTPATINIQPASPASPVQNIDCALGFGNAAVTVTAPSGTGIEYSLMVVRTRPVLHLTVLQTEVIQ